MWRWPQRIRDSWLDVLRKTGATAGREHGGVDPQYRPRGSTTRGRRSEGRERARGARAGAAGEREREGSDRAEGGASLGISILPASSAASSPAPAAPASGLRPGLAFAFDREKAFGEKPACGARAGRGVPERKELTHAENIYPVGARTHRALAALTRRAGDGATRRFSHVNLRRAVSRVALNMAEGMYSRRRIGTVRYTPLLVDARDSVARGRLGLRLSQSPDAVLVRRD